MIAGRGRSARIATYALLAGLMLVVAGLGQLGLGLSRALFVVGSFGVAWQARRAGGLALHVEISIALFVFAPLLRRLVDLHVGYDPAGTMLVGPLLALTAPLGDLRFLLFDRRRNLAVYAPYGLMLLCVAYAWCISAFQNTLVESSITAVKYAIPVLYCMCLIHHREGSFAVLQAAARTFLVISPVIGLYGVWQHLDPAPWDRFWMINSKMGSIGTPDPGQVRVFGTMNSPASFATYASCGLLLFSFTRRSPIPPVLVPVVALLPLSFALLLSGVRTAWIGVAVALAVCMLFSRLQRRAAWLTVCLGVGVAAALLLTSFGDVIGDRFSSMNDPSRDGSGYERMHDLMYVYSDSGRYLFGAGLAFDNDPNLAALDGQFLMSAVQMGIVVGNLHVLAIVWAGVQAVMQVRRTDDPLRLVAAALVVGDLVVLPLVAMSIGEIGFLFWMLIAVLTTPQPRPAAPDHRRRDAYRDRGPFVSFPAPIGASLAVLDPGRSTTS